MEMSRGADGCCGPNRSLIVAAEGCAVVGARALRAADSCSRAHSARAHCSTAWEALALDIRDSAAAKTIGVVGTRVNYEMSGTRSLFTSTGRKAKDFAEADRLKVQLKELGVEIEDGPQGTTWRLLP